jgi:hypothetical protein
MVQNNPPMPAMTTPSNAPTQHSGETTQQSITFSWCLQSFVVCNFISLSEEIDQNELNIS